MADIRGLDLGTILSVNPVTRRRLGNIWTGYGGIYPLDMEWVEKQWGIRGVLDAPSSTTVDSLYSLINHTNPQLLNLSDKISNFVRWTIVEDLDARIRKNKLYYDLSLRQIPCIGTTYVQNSGVKLLSYDYRAGHRIIDPQEGRYSPVYTSSYLNMQYDFYVCNKENSGKTCVLEVMIGDAVNEIEVYGYDDSGTPQWDKIGDWGNGDAWEATKSWTDGGGQSHTFQVGTASRGGSICGQTVSWLLGTRKRAIIEFTNLLANSNNDDDVPTDYRGDQLLLRVKIFHAAKGSLSYPIVSYVTGDLRQHVYI